ncbi:hypothetical protein J6590_101695 [Homalodisca vitripennis]|nr:hypothetical protein J6590_101695 [Homalodisca vitripennis]
MLSLLRLSAYLVKAAVPQPGIPIPECGVRQWKKDMETENCSALDHAVKENSRVTRA